MRIFPIPEPNLHALRSNLTQLAPTVVIVLEELPMPHFADIGSQYQLKKEQELTRVGQLHQKFSRVVFVEILTLIESL